MANESPGRIATATRLQVVTQETPDMSKSERLHRWAANLELSEQLTSIDDVARGARDRRRSTRGDSSPLTLAFEDWAFRAEGLRSDRVPDALAFFDLSEDEMRSIIGSFDHGGRTIPVAVAAQRVRALAEEAEDGAGSASRRTRERRLRPDLSGYAARHFLKAMDAAPPQTNRRGRNATSPGTDRRPTHGEKGLARDVSRASSPRWSG
jgi:hypothetical protein